jgi:hypothetical protein
MVGGEVRAASTAGAEYKEKESAGLFKTVARISPGFRMVSKPPNLLLEPNCTFVRRKSSSWTFPLSL